MANKHLYYWTIQKEMKRVNKETQQFASSLMCGLLWRAGSKWQPKFQPDYFLPLECEIDIPYLVKHLLYKEASYAMPIPFIYWNDEMKNYFDMTTKILNDFSNPDQYNDKQMVF
jgi:hypothetical protein